MPIIAYNNAHVGVLRILNYENTTPRLFGVVYIVPLEMFARVMVGDFYLTVPKIIIARNERHTNVVIFIFRLAYVYVAVKFALLSIETLLPTICALVNIELRPQPKTSQSLC